MSTLARRLWDSVLNSTLAIASLALLIIATTGCRCGGEDQPTDPVEPPTAAPPPEETAEEITPSPDVSQLIEAGDAAAIAADMEQRAARMRSIAASAGDRARTLESLAESITGREKPLDPRDPAVVDALVTSAGDLASGVDAMDPDLTLLRQLVVDLQAEAEALYGRPQP